MRATPDGYPYRASSTICIVRHQPAEGGPWYQWKALLTGTGDTDTFEDAVQRSLTYTMLELRSVQADPGARLLKPEKLPR
jgi:hypothetical protein